MKNYTTFKKENVEYVQHINDILDQIDEFINSNIRNVWIGNNLIKIYIRKSMRSIDGKLLPFFDFASIEVADEDNFGKGIFSKILKTFEEKYPDKNIFIESILEQRFLDYFLKNGFTIKDEMNAYKLSTI